MKMYRLIPAALAAAFALPAFSDDAYPPVWPVEKRILLKDGGALVVYKDGKTALESRQGLAMPRVMPGTTVVTASGETITLGTNESYRLDSTHPPRN